MPAILTHDFFGKDAMSDVSTQVTLLSRDAQQAFLLGNQGPDPLFYLVIDPRVSKDMRVGNLMHHAMPAKLLSSLKDALAMLTRAERPVGEAYVAGFLCHYLLDSTLHPLVFANELAIINAGVEGLDERDRSVVHAEIERDFDEMVLFSKKHETIETYLPYKEVLRASDATLAIIDKLYFYMILWTYGKTLQLDTFPRAVKSFRRMQRLFWTPSGKKIDRIRPLERAFLSNRYSLCKAMAHRPRAEETSPYANRHHKRWENPFTGVVGTESFWDLYEDALSRVFDAETAFFADDFDEAAAEELTGNLNFSGNPVDPTDGSDGDD